MLTIKLVEEPCEFSPLGHEQIHEVITVWTNPEDGTVHASLPHCNDPLNFSKHGVLYVMNGDGHTIAKYDLDMRYREAEARKAKTKGK